VILTGCEIEKQVRNGAIVIDPFRDSALNPNSYDLRLGDHLRVYDSGTIDVARYNPTSLIELPEEGLCLKGGGFYLGFSQERVGSEYFVPVLHAKSGTARAGLFVHVTANLIDIGSTGNLTFQLAPVLDVIVRPGMALAQVSFWKPIGEIDLYHGKYAGSVGPQASESYRDWAGRDGLPPEGA
jgi:dCTP deaminase